MRAIVTGGAGFIGSHLVDRLAGRGDEVYVVDDLSSGRRGNLVPGTELHEIDVRDPVVEGLGAELQCDVVFHLAAQADVATSVQRPAFDADVNVVGTVRMLEAARVAGARVVFASSGGAIYGECERPAREEDEPRPLSPYAVSKLAGEEYVAAWNRLHGTSHVALRLGNVYGPGQKPTLEGGVVAIFLERLSSGEEMQIFGDGTQTRDFIHVDDVVAAFLAAAAAGSGVYNIGTGVETSVTELHRLCVEAAGVEREPRYAPSRPGDLQRSVLDVRRAASELRWRPETPLDAGLARTWDRLCATAISSTLQEQTLNAADLEAV
jgi:UDP-glucose 4-epimerase